MYIGFGIRILPDKSHWVGVMGLRVGIHGIFERLGFLVLTLLTFSLALLLLGFLQKPDEWLHESPSAS